MGAVMTIAKAKPASFQPRSLRPKLLALSVAACFGLSEHVLANPTGASVVSGNASFATSGNALTVTNSANAVINWQSFSIGVNEITKFVQPSALSAVLNRVTGSGGSIPQSVIDGILSSNGNVFLLNPSGVIFGASARIDVAGMVASSLSLSNEDFLNGKMRFTDVPGAGSVINNGIIETTAGGRVFLVGSEVQNGGVIRSPQGHIVLAAGRSVELFSENTPFVTVRMTADTEHAVNLGSLIAESGKVGVFGALVRNAGVAEANSVVTGANGEIRFVATKDLNIDAGSRIAANGPNGGKVLLQAKGGTNLVAGTVEAKGASGKGGDIQALGVRVGVVGHGVIDASGDAGGGTVLVGGDYQGKNPDVQNSQRTLIGPDGVIRADAGTSGDGGRVIVWADEDTRFNGGISARGGSQSGNGGFVETSGKQLLGVAGRVDVGAPRGKGGTWLLDPDNVTITGSSSYGLADVDEFADYGGQSLNIAYSSIEGAIYGGSSVTIQAAHDVTFQHDLNLAYGAYIVYGGAPSFSVDAGDNIHLSGFNINASTPVHITLTANHPSYGYGGSITSTPGFGNITSGGGNIDLSGNGVTVGVLNSSGPSDGTFGNGTVNVTAAASNIVTSGITTRALSSAYNGGSVSLTTVDGRITVNGDIDTRGFSGPDLSSGGGSVTLMRNGTTPPVGDAAIRVDGNVNTYGGTPYGSIDASGADGNTVTVNTAYGLVDITGSIDTHGGNASGSDSYDGGWGGDVSITAESIKIGGSISTYGGNASNAAPDTGNTGGNGGYAGSVYLNATNGPVTVTGAIDAHGGSGGTGSHSAGANYGGRGGDGGEGSSVSIFGSTITTAGIKTSGGNAGQGGNGASSGGRGGDGGDGGIGGDVSLYASTGINVLGTIDTHGGTAGDGGAYGGAGGSNYYYYRGRGGDVYLSMSGTGNVEVHGNILTYGGNGGVGGGSTDAAMQGGDGGGGGNGGNVSLNGYGSGSSVAVYGSIDTRGGRAGDGGANGGSGGHNDYSYGSGGGVDISAPDGAVLVTGSIMTTGGDGGHGQAALSESGLSGGWGGVGGEGGSVYVSGTSVTVKGAIKTSGGNGGNGGDGDVSTSAGVGGMAGYYGNVDITSYGGPIYVGTIDTSGGNGGHSGLSPVASSGGNGADGGEIRITAYGGATVTIGNVYAYGGNAGNGASGGDGGEGASIYISGGYTSSSFYDGIVEQYTNTNAGAGNVSIGVLDTHGGAGGRNLDPSYINRGQGGDGGYVEIDGAQVDITSLIGYGGDAGPDSGQRGGNGAEFNIAGSSTYFTQYDYSVSPYIVTYGSSVTAAGSVSIASVDIRGGKGGATITYAYNAWGGDGGDGSITANSVKIGSYTSYGGNAGTGSTAGGGDGGSLIVQGGSTSSNFYDSSNGNNGYSNSTSGAAGNVSIGPIDAHGGNAELTLNIGEGNSGGDGGWLEVYANGNVSVGGFVAYGGNSSYSAGWGGGVIIAGGSSRAGSSTYDASSNTTTSTNSSSFSPVNGPVQILGPLVDIQGGSGDDGLAMAGYGGGGGGSGGIQIFSNGPVSLGAIAAFGGLTDPDSGRWGGSGGEVTIAGGHQHSETQVQDNSTGVWGPRSTTDTWQLVNGAITTGAIDTHGTNAAGSISYQGGDGGEGGAVTLRGMAVSVMGDIDSHGGSGGNGASGYDGGKAGWGGAVQLESAGDVAAGLIVTSGGAAGSGAYGGSNGSPSSHTPPHYYGSAGDVKITAVGDVFINGIVANAGAGGNGDASVGYGGNAGLAGNIAISGAEININGPLMNSGASGGTGGLLTGTGSADGTRAFTSSVFRYSNLNAPMGINQSFFTGISAPLVVLGNTTTTPYLVVEGPLDLAGRRLSLLASGDVSSLSGITAAGLNADGANVSILGTNHIQAIQGAARNGNFVFQTAGSVDVGTVDPGNVAPGVSASGVAQISAGGDITSAIIGSYAVSGGAVVLTSTGGAIGSETAPLQVGTTVLSAAGNTGVSIELNTLSPAFAAVDSLVNTGAGDILLLAHGGARTNTEILNAGGDISIKTFSPLQVLDGADAAGGITLETSGIFANGMLLDGTFSHTTGFKVVIGPSGLLLKGSAFVGSITEQIGGEELSGSTLLAINDIFQAVSQTTNAITQTSNIVSGNPSPSGSVTDKDEKKDKEDKDKKGLGVCKP
jgi:filamentous hemagglutinin family protein